MQVTLLSNSDKEWLLIKHPELEISGNKISGLLRFYDYQIKSEPFTDTYEIYVSFSKRGRFPVVIETGDRIEKIPDRHINGDGTTCICGPIGKRTYEQNNPTIEKFFSEYLVPYFASQTYYEKYGKWPFGELSHGVLGVLEDINEHWPAALESEFLIFALQQVSTQCRKTEIELLKKMIVEKAKIKAHKNCLCSSGCRFSECHGQAFDAIYKLRKEWRKYLSRSEIEQIFDK